MVLVTSYAFMHVKGDFVLPQEPWLVPTLALDPAHWNEATPGSLVAQDRVLSLTVDR